MTYCCGILVRDGLVMIADTRTNAGLDNISVFRKLHVFSVPGERIIAVASAGNLSLTQSVLSMLHEGLENPETGEHEILGRGRLIKVRGTKDAELALVVSDRFQGLGLGTELVRRLIQVGRDENIDRIFGDILPQNVEMQRICEKLGFKMTHNVKESLIRAEIEL